MKMEARVSGNGGAEGEVVARERARGEIRDAIEKHFPLGDPSKKFPMRDVRVVDLTGIAKFHSMPGIEVARTEEAVVTVTRSGELEALPLTHETSSGEIVQTLQGDFFGTTSMPLEKYPEYKDKTITAIVKAAEKAKKKTS